MLIQHIKELKLPELFPSDGGCSVNADNYNVRRDQLYTALCEHEFGYMPSAPAEVRSAIKSTDTNAYCGKATETYLTLSFDTPGGEFSFPVYYLTPNKPGKSPAIIHIAFRTAVPDRYVPCEEIIDRGFSLALFCYNDVTVDATDGYNTGIAKMYGERTKTSCSKIGMWAFAASRVVDYLVTRPEIDTDNIAVMGHSRLGKTSLWAGASDERFKYVISNDSGCAGDALAREAAQHSDAEHVGRISTVFPEWFSGDYHTYGERETEMPYDQHWLLALTAPRFLYIASASADKWACPEAGYLSCVAASEAWEINGKDGFLAYDRYPRENDTFHDGCIGYHLRPGTHFLSRYDWNKYMDFIEKKMKNK